MLKITTTHKDSFECVLKLEGKLVADWVSELQEACRRASGQSSHLQLDLSSLSFVDASGTIALRELIRCGIAITTTSPLVRELLKEN
jgi:anti-anti-sigma regulatory factor